MNAALLKVGSDRLQKNSQSVAGLVAASWVWAQTQPMSWSYSGSRIGPRFWSYSSLRVGSVLFSFSVS